MKTLLNGTYGTRNVGIESPFEIKTELGYLRRTIGKVNRVLERDTEHPYLNQMLFEISKN